LYVRNGNVAHDGGMLNHHRAAGRIGGYVLRSRHDPRQYTANARSAFLARFEREVDPDGVLPPEERLARAKAALKAHMLRLAYKSAKKRRRKAARQEAAP
jgi:hypothetical protein